MVCEYAGGTLGRVLRVYIEREDGAPVMVSDCITVNDLVTDLLDVEDPIPTAYSLEVSSPGIERPLKRPEHFAEQVGNIIRVRTWEALTGRRNWKGELVSLEDDILTVEVDGEDHRIPIPAIERANVVHEPALTGQKKGGSARMRRSRKR